jgi:hypothetical protein
MSLFDDTFLAYIMPEGIGQNMKPDITKIGRVQAEFSNILCNSLILKLK